MSDSRHLSGIHDLWERITPVPQIIGFIILCVFFGTTYFTKFEAMGIQTLTNKSMIEAQDVRLRILESGQASILTKLDDLSYYLHSEDKRK